jgi:hypothetical protein
MRPTRLPRLLGRSATSLLVVIFAGACDSPFAPLPDGPPEQFEFSIGGFGVASNRWKLSGDTILAIQSSWDSPSADTVRHRPSAAEWSRFWRSVNEAGVRRWRSRYMAEGVIDGEGWALRIAGGSLHVDSNGSNAYPDHLGFEHELDRPAAFEAFVRAVRELGGAVTR